MLKVRLNRDLRKNILRGHPWIYREAIDKPSKAAKAVACEVLDKKGKGVAWGFYCPESPLAVRILSTEKKPPNQNFLAQKMERALNLRNAGIGDQTNGFRLFNGEGDALPGMVCDVYDHVAVLQFDGRDCFEFWDQDWVAQWLLENLSVRTIYFKPRRSDSLEPQWWGEKLENPLVKIKENGHSFWVNIVDGQKTGFFLDQRDNRDYLGKLCRGKKLLNLFSYTGGFSIYGGVSGAKEVTSVDLSAPALELAQKSWEENNLDPKKHKTCAVDVFEFLKNPQEPFDVVMVDPPSMTHSEKNKQAAMRSYEEVFSQAARLVESQQHLVLSSCSSHISFQDFFEIINGTLSQVRRTGKILKVSGQGIDHPFPHFCPELRYLKFVHLILD